MYFSFEFKLTMAYSQHGCSYIGTKRSIEYNRGGVGMWFLVERERARESTRAR